MNQLMKTTLGVALAIACTAPVRAGEDPIRLHATTTIGPETVILDLFADTGEIPLRSFGIKVKFDPESLSIISAGRYQELWFLAHESGARLPYTDTRVDEDGSVRIVGGRLEANEPDRGVRGSRILLATLEFKGRAGAPPEFAFDFASPAPFANFVRVDGECVDTAVEPAKAIVTTNQASRDSDRDGLPDPYEIAAFGDLATSEGTGDSDGDGESDLDEWIRGTDPSDPGSRSTLRVEVLADGSRLIRWTGRAGRVYDLERSDTLDRFEVLASGIAGSDGLLMRLDEGSAPNPDGFYRVRAHFPTAGR